MDIAERKEHRDRGLIEQAFLAAYLQPPSPSSELIAQVAAELARESGLVVGEQVEEPKDGDGLLEVVLGCRRLRDTLREVELEAARKARARGVTVRQLAAATGMADRRASDRYRRDNS